MNNLVKLNLITILIIKTFTLTVTQLAWTAIQVDSQSMIEVLWLYFLYIIINKSFLNILGRIDLWTRNSTGCKCNQINNSNDEYETEATSFQNNSSNDNKCACCGKGGCQCGPSLTARCGQCGLENYCTNSEYIE